MKYPTRSFKVEPSVLVLGAVQFALCLAINGPIFFSFSLGLGSQTAEVRSGLRVQNIHSYRPYILFLLKLFPSSKRPIRTEPKRIMVGDGQLENHARRSAQLLRLNQLPLNLIKLELPEFWIRKRNTYAEGIKKAILIPDELDYYN